MNNSKTALRDHLNLLRVDRDTAVMGAFATYARLAIDLGDRADGIEYVARAIAIGDMLTDSGLVDTTPVMSAVYARLEQDGIASEAMARAKVLRALMDYAPGEAPDPEEQE